MNTIFYVRPDGTTYVHGMVIHSGHYGDTAVDVMATGVTADSVDWQFTAQVRIYGEHRSDTLAVIYDETRYVIALEGNNALPWRALAALRDAGFDLSSFDTAPIIGSGFDVDEDEPETFDAVSFVMAYEGGELGEDEVVEGFQHMLNSGLVWQLQGHYGRTASALLDAGLIHRRDRWAD